MIESVIRQRRTVKPAQMNGKLIPDDVISTLLELADWAPTHGKTEPWRFIVYGPDKIQQFCIEHAKLYKENTILEKYKEASYEKLLHAADGASHIILSYMKRGGNPNIPEIEEIAATAAAVQNILLAAASYGIAVFWSTSGMVHHEVLKDYFGLEEEDRFLGILYLGYSDDPSREGKRSTPLSEKIRWVK